MNKMKVLLMFTNHVDMEGEDGRKIQGVSAEYYFFGENGEQLESKVSASGETGGIRRAKVFLSPEMQNKVSYIPGIYEGTFELGVGGDGKPMLKLVDIDFSGKAVILEDKVEG